MTGPELLQTWRRQLDSRRLQWAAAGLALALSGWFLIGLITLWLAPSGGFAVNVEPLRPQAQTMRLAWFQTARPDAAPNATPVVTEEVLNASINAELLGVVIQGDAAWATIQTPRAPNAVYQVGDEISSGVTLTAVEPLRVLVSERGVQRQIALKALRGGNSGDGDALIERVQSSAAAPGFSLSGVMGGTPIQVEGYGLGFRLDNLDAEIEQVSELRARDIILSVAGQPVSALLSNPQQWQQLLLETSLTVAILRDGVEQQITVNARSLGERILPTLNQGLVQ